MRRAAHSILASIAGALVASFVAYLYGVASGESDDPYFMLGMFFLPLMNLGLALPLFPIVFFIIQESKSSPQRKMLASLIGGSAAVFTLVAILSALMTADVGVARALGGAALYGLFFIPGWLVYSVLMDRWLKDRQRSVG